MGTYTVRQASPTGKVDPEYGAEYIVNFNEDLRDVRMSRKEPIVAGQVEVGTIVPNAKYGPYFKKDPKAPEGTSVTKKQWVPMKKNNSDGQRQGMCFNNAANYVNGMATELVAPEIWAKTVWDYASALYHLGDLGQESQPESTAEVFSGHK